MIWCLWLGVGVPAHGCVCAEVVRSCDTHRRSRDSVHARGSARAALWLRAVACMVVFAVMPCLLSVVRHVCCARPLLLAGTGSQGRC